MRYFTERVRTERPVALGGRLTAATHVVAATQGEATVLLDVERGRYHTLNAVGGRVWALLAAGTTVGDIVRTLHAEYALPLDTPADRVERDVMALLAQLRDAGLLDEAAPLGPERPANG